MRGRVVAVHGRHFLVEDDTGICECVTRGKKGGVACGDQVTFEITSAGKGVIESIEPRHNLLYRSDEFRSKLLAANIDQAAIVVAAVPAFNEELLIRCLVACEVAEIPALIVLNKADLPETEALARALAPYAELGYPLLLVSAKEEVAMAEPLRVPAYVEGSSQSTAEPLRVPPYQEGSPRGLLAELDQCLSDKTTVFVGASGVGKSTLLNRLVPDANATTGEISLALDAGKHTTTHARLFHLPASGGALIDSPGMQEFGLKHLNLASLMAAFPEIHSRHGQCRFYNCRHLKEPGCAVLEAAKDGAIMASRIKVYHWLLAGIK
ncbi:MAG: ribosome small subunit-dependent GTPase A [Pseudomonadota bacterium]|nr:ribosome small subunit-dependent GTPase A [Pseudomonadota bacterium]MDP1903433.1 ribosome small subunit-dependent GTPase A [Pseudomonadota bacterium]